MQLHDGRLSLQRFYRAAGPSLDVDVDLDELGRFGHMDILGHRLAVAAYLDAVRARKQRDMGCPIAVCRTVLTALLFWLIAIVAPLTAWLWVVRIKMPG